MGQYFYLCNLDNSKHVANSVSGKFGEFYFCPMDAGTQLLRALWSPPEDEKRVVVLPLNKAEGFSFPQESNENLSKGLLNQLSNEIIGIIIGEVLDLLDLVSLMVTCQRYWEIGRHHLERLIQDFIVVSWAGDRLICLGDYAKLEDLPNGMLTDSEVERIRSFCDKYDQSWQEGISIIRTPTSTTMRPMRPISSASNFAYELHLIAFDPKRMVFRHELKIYDVLAKLILIKDLDPDDFFDGSLVFRNLITKEYVRGDGITKAWDTPDKPWLEGMRFEHVLYIRTTWSSDPSLNCIYDGPLQIHRGVWAGHRFDVTSIGRVLDEDGFAVDNWKDVTKEVINEVIEIWEPEGIYDHSNH